jgi:hypothetical protein
VFAAMHPALLEKLDLFADSASPGVIAEDWGDEATPQAAAWCAGHRIPAALWTLHRTGFASGLLFRQWVSRVDGWDLNFRYCAH